MPKPIALSPEIRRAVLYDIDAGHGRNAIARRRGISTGSVSNIARQHYRQFPKVTQTALGTRAHSIDCAAARLDREEELWSQFQTTPITRRRDGEETKASRHLSYALYNLHRHAQSHTPL